MPGLDRQKHSEDNNSFRLLAKGCLTKGKLDVVGLQPACCRPYTLILKGIVFPRKITQIDETDRMFSRL